MAGICQVPERLVPVCLGCHRPCEMRVRSELMPPMASMKREECISNPSSGPNRSLTVGGSGAGSPARRTRGHIRRRSAGAPGPGPPGPAVTGTAHGPARAGWLPCRAGGAGRGRALGGRPAHHRRRRDPPGQVGGDPAAGRHGAGGQRRPVRLHQHQPGLPGCPHLAESLRWAGSGPGTSGGTCSITPTRPRRSSARCTRRASRPHLQRGRRLPGHHRRAACPQRCAVPRPAGRRGGPLARHRRHQPHLPGNETLRAACRSKS
jgi:hypothetical protein